MALAQQGLTLEEFLRLPEQEPALEEEGRILQKVALKGRHSRLQYRIAEYFNRFAEPRKLALAFPELLVTFGGRSYVPDVAVYLWDRIPADTAGSPMNSLHRRTSRSRSRRRSRASTLWCDAVSGISRTMCAWHCW